MLKVLALGGLARWVVKNPVHALIGFLLLVTVGEFLLSLLIGMLAPLVIGGVCLYIVILVAKNLLWRPRA